MKRSWGNLSCQNPVFSPSSTGRLTDTPTTSHAPCPMRPKRIVAKLAPTGHLGRFLSCIWTVAWSCYATRLPIGFLVVLETTPDTDRPSASSIFFLFRHLLSLFVRPKVSWQARQKYEGGQNFGKFTRFPPRPGSVV